MAAAVFEALFSGNDDFDFEPDPGRRGDLVLRRPDLNEQTRFRLMEAADKVTSSDLVVVEPPFAKPRSTRARCTSSTPRS